MATRLSGCASCGAAVAFGYDNNDNQLVTLEPTGFGATINKDGRVSWQDTFKQHMCPPAAARSRTAWIESITTEEERRRAQDIAEQRELAKELAKTFDCPKLKCEAKVDEGCINLTVLNRTGERKPTAWPHPERMELALKALNALSPAEQEEENDGDKAADQQGT